MIKSGDDFASVSTYSQKPVLIQIQAKLTTRLLRRTVTEKFKAQNIKLLGITWPFPKYLLDAMNIPPNSISGDTISDNRCLCEQDQYCHFNSGLTDTSE
jgi:hypothetical protein